MATSGSDSDSQDESQIKQFLEAADHTLLNNAMFQQNSTSNSLIQTNPPPRIKSERHLEHEQCTNETVQRNDLKISQKMQTHFWNKLSQIIHNRIEFCHIETSEQSDEILIPCCVKLVSNAECFLNNDIVKIDPPGPVKKPIIRKRRLLEETGTEAQNDALDACVVSGEDIYAAKDTINWSKRRCHPNKFFAYKSKHTIKGQELIDAVKVIPTNEFTLQRFSNNWDESKISQKKTKVQ